MTAYIKRGALLPELELTATKKDPVTGIVSPVDLTLADTVTVVLWNVSRTGSTVITGDATDVDFENGVCKYTWQTGDTDVPGDYHVELVVVWPGSLPEYFPTGGTASLVIDDSSFPYLNP